ncbi:MAG TPA: cytochrome c peroxidase [Bacteroidia bacterium]|nr:cytochrome-c peroxidase [Bacteroidota bacterium]MCE7955123.1 cytochrome-c peroxidase [Bacteroidetes bacterium CHB6]HRV52614.1 cytochrome c peroxidase [Bacteroidia bacterium]
MNRKITGIFFIVLFVVISSSLITSCRKDDAIDTGNEVLTLEVPTGFPYPNIPDDNQPTKNRIALGKKLFFDPILSRDSTISCSSCHHTDKKMTDGLPVSQGIDGRHVLRNAMTVLNTAYQPNMFWDGGSPTLEQQVVAPIESHEEMDFNVLKVVERLKNHPEYPELFLKAYNLEPSPYTLTRAIANFERTLFTGKSKYDQYQYDKNTNALSASEKRGMDIFFGERGECFHCHGGFNFTDFSFKNNGLYEVYADSGRARITTLHSDVGKFKVPSLRNVELTAPYMHDGSMATLEEVVEHYSSGGKPHFNKSFLIQPLNLTQQEKTDLINFMKALTDL